MNKHLIRLCIFILVGAVSHSQAQIVDWTQGPGQLGLGYPVPIPVDTPLPFDGFRTYDGLHARHQDLSLTTPWVHSEVIGQTRLARDIWLYQLGDADHVTAEGLAEPAMLINGGIHAREWQSPEVVTGVLELLATAEDDPLIDYLRDNVNSMVIPVLNIDGFLQTQRFPRSNYLGTNPSDVPNDPQPSPRDGRMRRKNLLATDEDLFTANDHLFGVDLNRNNSPFWATSNSSSFSPNSIVHHGSAPGSEPEIQALYEAATHGPENRLRSYADAHSFGKVYFSINTLNTRRNAIQSRLINVMINHHAVLPGNKIYVNSPNTPGFGLGLTSEYFATTFQIPSWTLEIEPLFSSTGLRGGLEYGGLGTNGHDGFILPESEVQRVRENLAKTIATGFYHMAGPPSIQSMQLIDEDSGAAIAIAQWEVSGDTSRELFHHQISPIELGHPYRLWISFNKPMRWRDSNGNVTNYPGQSSDTLDFDFNATAGNNFINVEQGQPQWLNEPGGSPAGYNRYRDDAVSIPLSFTDNSTNRNLLQLAQNAGNPIRLRIATMDLTGHALDANPATVVDWQNAAWANYENNNGTAGDIGGIDNTLSLDFTLNQAAPAFLVGSGISANWFDPSRDGEGLMLEIHPNERAGVYWLTYDENGGQRWLLGLGEVRGNRVVFPALQVTGGGRFGPDFDPDEVTRTVAVKAELIFDSCDSGWFFFEGFDQRGRMPLRRITRTMSVDCNPPANAVSLPAAVQSGSWFDIRFDGQGYGLHWLVNGAMVLQWFTYDPQGHQVYLIGVGTLQDDEIIFDELVMTRGARFGDAFDAADVERIPWGSLRIKLACDSGEAHYESIIEGFGSGDFVLQRLTTLAGLQCPASQ